MKWLLAILVVLLVMLQVRLWVGDGGVADVRRIGEAVDIQKNKNRELKERQQALEGEVKDLKKGLEAIEERARSELGMIKKDETFYQVIEE